MPRDKVKCPSCGGSGAFKERAQDPKSGKDRERLITCKKCKGKGYVNKPNRWSPR